MTRRLIFLIAATIPLLSSCVKRNPDISAFRFYHHYDHYFKENTLFILNDLPRRNVTKMEFCVSGDTLYFNKVVLVAYIPEITDRYLHEVALNTVKLNLRENIRHITYQGQTIDFSDIPLDTLNHPRSYRPCIFEINYRSEGSITIK